MLGIFSANFPQGPQRPSINLRRRVPTMRVIQQTDRRGRGVNVIGTESPLIRMSVTNTRTLTLQQV
jgi:hypothetical protein